MGKPGRNDPCPCGRGKKFKHCCIEIYQLPPAQEAESRGLTPAWMDHVQFTAAIRILGALRLDPRNLGKHVRLDAAFDEIMSTPPKGSRPIDPRRFMSWINDERIFKDPIQMEDPPEGLFTENVCFHGGNYIVYPGIQESPAHIFENLLAAVHLNRDTYPSDVVREVNAAAQFLLSVSDRIAKRMGHDRWMRYPERQVAKGAVLDQGQLERRADAVTFPTKEIFSIAQL